MSVEVTKAPTRFGPVSYRVSSAADDGCIDAVIDPPTRDPLTAIVLRLRHPEEKRLQRVTVNGQAHDDFDADREVIRIKPADTRIEVRAFY